MALNLKNLFGGGGGPGSFGEDGSFTYDDPSANGDYAPQPTPQPDGGQGGQLVLPNPDENTGFPGPNPGNGSGLTDEFGNPVIPPDVGGGGEPSPTPIFGGPPAGGPPEPTPGPTLPPAASPTSALTPGSFATPGTVANRPNMPFNFRALFDPRNASQGQVGRGSRLPRVPDVAPTRGRGTGGQGSGGQGDDALARALRNLK